MNIVPQICGLCISCVLYYFFRKQRKLSLESQTAFIRVWQIGVVSATLDILAAVVRYHQEWFSIPVTILVYILYHLSLLWTQVFGLLYVNANIAEQHTVKQRETKIHIGYGIVGSLVILLVPLASMIDYNPDVYRVTTTLTYIFSMILLINMAVTVIGHRRQMTKQSRIGVLSWVSICLVTCILQFIIRDVVMVAFASALGVMIIYLKLENPERFVDTDTGLFNFNAFQRYVRQLEEEKKSVSVLYVDYEQIGQQMGVLDREVRLEVIHFLDKLKKAYPFRGTEEGIMLMFEKEGDLLSAINVINNRFEAPWGKYKDVILKTRMIYLDDILQLKKAGDVKKLFSYIRHDSYLYEESDFIVVDKTIIDAAYNEENIEQMIMEALEQDRVEVFYQPIYSTVSKKFGSAEALVRIRREDGSVIMPNVFIDIAEKRGSIIELGGRVFDKVCSLIENTDMENLGLDYIEVNLSAVQCGYKNLASEFIAIMEKHHVAPRYINLEITESASIHNEKIFLDNINKLREYGISFSLDDFGTGQSNLNYIVAMPVDIVKFDRGMVQSYFSNDKAKYVMDAAMGMIQGMDLEIVSEGIESKDQLNIMEDLGIQYIQGYYFSKPLPEAGFLDFIQQKRRSA